MHPEITKLRVLGKEPEDNIENIFVTLEKSYIIFTTA